MTEWIPSLECVVWATRVDHATVALAVVDVSLPALPPGQQPLVLRVQVRSPRWYTAIDGRMVEVRTTTAHEMIHDAAAVQWVTFSGSEVEATTSSRIAFDVRL